jgi:hypothetical protein
MTDFPNGIEARADAICLLRQIDGRESGGTGEWTIDDFASAPQSDPKIDACRLRVRDELISLLASKDASDRARISPLVDRLIQDLEDNAQD